MKAIIDKSMLLICCFTLILSDDSFVFPVIALLTAISVSSVSQVFGKNYISLAAEIIYLVSSLFIKEFVFFLPVVLYHVFNERRFYLCPAAVVAVFVHARMIDAKLTFVTVVFIMLAALLQKRTSTLSQLQQKLIGIRDSFAEVNMLLAENNKKLLENQEYEIHLATLKERNRIAREIHDNVGHVLSRAILQVGALQLIDDEDLRCRYLESLSQSLNNAMTDIRKSVHDLHDDSIDLIQSINDAVKPLEELNVAVNAELENLQEMPNKTKICVISIIKEAVSNIIKHSSADSVRIILREQPAFYQLVIQDNGACGSVISESGIGLSNMRERVNGLGGIINVSSGKDGFRIFVSLKK